MSFTDNNDPNEGDGPLGLREELKRTKKELKAERELADKWRQHEANQVFVTAGVPIDDPRAEYFMAGYRKDRTPEAIRAEWEATFGQTSPRRDTGQDQIDAELAALNGALDLTSAVPQISPDKLTERDQKLAELSQSDPRYAEKFDAIFAAYGGKRGGLVG